MAVSATIFRSPVVVILGATGTGKSKLAIKLAKRFSGEIISADSMQVYKGLDIVTNKVTNEEAEGIPHYMMDYISPLQRNYTVVDYQIKALQTIKDIHQAKRIPIIVGGTNYYIEALLWNFLLSNQDSTGSHTKDGTLVANNDQPTTTPSCVEQRSTKRNKPADGADIRYPQDGSMCTDESTVGQDETARKKYKMYSDEQLQQRLAEVDQESAKRIHPNDRRKIMRALEVYEQQGKPMTQLLNIQHLDQGDGALSGPLRFTNPCVIWIKSHQNVLDERTDKRVDAMIELGLLKELQDFHSAYNEERIQTGGTADYTLGIFQSIGFKEFHDYLILPKEKQDTDIGKQILEKGIDDMKRVTRRYARKQNKWINSRFLKRQGSNVPRVYSVDASDVSRWLDDVYQPAECIVDAYLQGKTPDIEPEPVSVSDDVAEYNVCHVCGDKVFTRRKQYLIHLDSRRHKKALAGEKARLKRTETGGEDDKQKDVDELSDTDTSDDDMEESDNT